MNLFIYSNALRPVHDSIEPFIGTTPFGGDGIKNNFQIVDDSKRADLIWMGQYNDKPEERWLLHPNRFRYFAEYPEKHVIDLEGDWRDQDFPEWLKPARIITGNAHLSLFDQGWRIFVRPIMSPLLMRLIRNPPDFRPPIHPAAWFRGQHDSLGVRQKLKDALRLFGKLDYQWEFTERWMVYEPEDSFDVKRYVDLMRDYSIALCPRGEGMATCRFYEACAFGRAAVIIADNVIAGERLWELRISDQQDVQSMARDLQAMWSDRPALAEAGLARAYFETWLIPYFQDPTKTFLKWVDFS